MCGCPVNSGSGRPTGQAIKRTEWPIGRAVMVGRYVGMGQRKKPLWPMLRHQYIYYQKFQLGKSFKVVGYFLPKAIFARCNNFCAIELCLIRLIFA